MDLLHSLMILTEIRSGEKRDQIKTHGVGTSSISARATGTAKRDVAKRMAFIESYLVVEMKRVF